MSDYEGLKIKDWAEDDRPREKLIGKGTQALSDAELLAVIIGSGNKNETAVDLSKKILKSVDNSLFRLGQLSIEQLRKHKGIGEARAVSIAAAMELARRRADSSPQKRTKIINSQDAFGVLSPYMCDLQHEEFWIILLNKANEVISVKKTSMGGIDNSTGDIRIIFRLALENSATSLIISHNHPSGNLNPSAEDIALTKRIHEAGKIMNIPLRDHLIIAENSYISLADKELY